MEFLQLIIDGSVIAGIWWEIYSAIKYTKNIGNKATAIVQSEYVLVDFDKSTVTYKKLPYEYKGKIITGTRAILSAMLLLISFFAEIIVNTDIVAYFRIIFSVPIGIVLAYIISLLSKVISDIIIKLASNYAASNGITRKIKEDEIVH